MDARAESKAFVERIMNECADSIERATPEEIAAEMAADGVDVAAVAAETKRVLLDAVEKYASPSIPTETREPEMPEWERLGFDKPATPSDVEVIQAGIAFWQKKFDAANAQVEVLEMALRLVLLKSVDMEKDLCKLCNGVGKHTDDCVSKIANDALSGKP